MTYGLINYSINIDCYKPIKGSIYCVQLCYTFCCSCYFVYPITSTPGWSVQWEKSVEKGCLNRRVLGCKALRESAQVSLRTYCTALSVLGGGVCVVLWLESWPAQLEHLPVGDLFPRLWAGSRGAGLQRLSTGCGVGSLWLQRPGSFAYRDSMEAQAHFKAQWKTNQAPRIYSQISFVFPSFMRKAEIAVPCC